MYIIGTPFLEYITYSRFIEGSIITIISASFPHSSMTTLSLLCTCRIALAASSTASARPSCVSTTQVKKILSVVTVADDPSALLYLSYVRCLLTSATLLSFISPFLFYVINSRESKAFLFSSQDRSEAVVGLFVSSL